MGPMSRRILCRFPESSYSMQSIMMKLVVCAMLAALLLGCSKQEETKPVAEIKGKAINSAPVTNLAQTALVVTNPEPAKAGTTDLTNALPAEAGTTNAEPALVNGYFQVGFDKLSGFHYIMPDEISATNQPPADQFPPPIKALNEKPIALRGFMLPLKVDQGLVTEMLIMRDQSMCCFGTSPKINEWVSVKMSEKGVKPVMDQPVTLFGKLKVGEMRENGYLVGIYEMMGDKMEWE